MVPTLFARKLALTALAFVTLMAARPASASRYPLVAQDSSNGVKRGLPRATPRSIMFDFNGDGYTDLLFPSQSTGNVGYITLTGSSYLGSGYISTDVGLDYKVVGAASFRGNTTPDVSYQQDQFNGEVGYVLLSGLTITSFGDLFQGLNLDFKIVGVH